MNRLGKDATRLCDSVHAKEYLMVVRWFIGMALLIVLLLGVVALAQPHSVARGAPSRGVVACSGVYTPPCD